MSNLLLYNDHVSYDTLLAAPLQHIAASRFSCHGVGLGDFCFFAFWTIICRAFVFGGRF
jgi:hypothetical protein